MGWKQRVGLTLFVAAMAGCDAKATDEDCTQACENMTRLYLQAVDEKTASEEILKQMGASGASMAKEMASIQLEYLRHECERECKSKATRKQTECIKAATTTDEALRCN